MLEQKSFLQQSCWKLLLDLKDEMKFDISKETIKQNKIAYVVLQCWFVVKAQILCLGNDWKLRISYLLKRLSNLCWDVGNTYLSKDSGKQLQRFWGSGLPPLAAYIYRRSWHQQWAQQSYIPQQSKYNCYNSEKYLEIKKSLSVGLTHSVCKNQWEWTGLSTCGS